MRSGSSALLWDRWDLPLGSLTVSWGEIHLQGVSAGPGRVCRSDPACKHPWVMGHPRTPVGPPSSCGIQHRESQEQDMANVAVVCDTPPGATLLQGATPPAAPSSPPAAAV